MFSVNSHALLLSKGGMTAVLLFLPLITTINSRLEYRRVNLK